MKNISATPFSNTVLQDLSKHGWGFVQLKAGDSDSLGRQLLQIASVLGTPQLTRNKALVDRLIPLEKDQAHPKSLSALTGLGVQPWHVDFSHCQTPARYIILACEHEGSNPVHTELVYWTSLFDAADQEAALAEPFLVRNGCHSFYATILTHSQQYLRFDPGCMQPVTKGAKKLMGKLSSKNINPIVQIDWESERAVIIDNWRMLHRRLDAHGTEGRVLLRVSVTGEGRR